MKDKIVSGVKDIGRRVVIKVALQVIKHINRDVDVSTLEEQFGQKVKKTIQIYVKDKGVKLAFRVEDGQLKYIKNPKNIDAKGIIDSNTFLSLVAGKKKVMDPATGETKLKDYGPYEAYMSGDIEIYGDNVTADYYLLFKYVWNRVKDDIHSTVGSRLAKALAEE